MLHDKALLLHQASPSAKDQNLLVRFGMPSPDRSRRSQPLEGALWHGEAFDILPPCRAYEATINARDGKFQSHGKIQVKSVVPLNMVGLRDLCHPIRAVVGQVCVNTKIGKSLYGRLKLPLTESGAALSASSNQRCSDLDVKKPRHHANGMLVRQYPGNTRSIKRRAL